MLMLSQVDRKPRTEAFNKMIFLRIGKGASLWTGPKVYIAYGESS